MMDRGIEGANIDIGSKVWRSPTIALKNDGNTVKSSWGSTDPTLSAHE